MKDSTRKTLQNLAAHADNVLASVEAEWPEEEAKENVMSRSDRQHLLAAIRQMGIVARRAASRNA